MSYAMGLARGFPANRREPVMAKVSPYYTNSPEYPPQHRQVHHDHDNCPDGRKIQPNHRRTGMGGKPPCKECQKLD